jgi:hypothetical protein
VTDGTRTRNHRDHNPGLYQLSYGHRAGASLARRGPELAPVAAVTHYERTETITDYPLYRLVVNGAAEPGGRLRYPSGPGRIRAPDPRLRRPSLKPPARRTVEPNALHTSRQTTRLLVAFCCGFVGLGAARRTGSVPALSGTRDYAGRMSIEPRRIQHFRIALSRDTVELPWASRAPLLERLRKHDAGSRS